MRYKIALCVSLRLVSLRLWLVIGMLATLAACDGSSEVSLADMVQDADNAADWYEDAGENAYRSGDIGNDQQSCITYAAKLPGQLSFHWKVSSEGGYDYLSFYKIIADGTAQRLHRISGERGWEKIIVQAQSEQTTYRWCYEKDISDYRGEDTGYVNRIALQKIAHFYEEPTTN